MLIKKLQWSEVAKQREITNISSPLQTETKSSKIQGCRQAKSNTQMKVTSNPAICYSKDVTGDCLKLQN